MVTLRSATWRDAWRLYRWRTDVRTATFMDQPAPRSFLGHCWWLRGALNDPRRLFFVAVADVDGLRMPVGTVRLDRTRAARAVDMSVTIDARLRGRRLGTATICAAVERGASEGIDSFFATILIGNHASRIAFERATFEHYGTGQRYWYYRRRWR